MPFFHAITTGKTFDRYIAVDSGLKEDDIMVIAGQINLVDGRELEIINH
ncbi:MAG: hypothetical protein LBK97_07400 [Prevotellaceae bacterium]|jgi:hypothetical protein|nr:hypothetical protein [Prevotellaceae bacterium]